MASSRTRSASLAAASSSSSEEASLAPWAPAQSLSDLKEAMGSPGVIQAEVDALLAAIARPPAPDETPRARADLLLALMDLPEEARDRTGSNGKTVRVAALEALLELGYPYALEVHPEVLEAVRQQTGGRKRDAREGGSTVGVILTLLALVVQVFLAMLLSSSSIYSSSSLEMFQLVRLGLVVGPPLLALFGQMAESKGLRSLGARGMTLQGLAWLAFSGLESLRSSSGGLLLLLMIPWYLPLLAAYQMRAKSEPGDEAPALATTTPPPPTEPS
ncbi:hypothetical protein [Pyxidicoccus caerfyrddinensis]|uniref:hypothetical protein n=1 Tax=Pyxidicoccus caerfyrddinensis TaxID=2709663 RepID=UPI0013DAC003|nr:hypothetical protein [Pyxidicoccus caerfyrddinensis]